MTTVDDPGQYFSSRILRLQAPYQEGQDVRTLQSLLNMLPDHIIHSTLDTDGIFGVDTRNAVRDLQKYFKLNANGIVSDQTFYHLGQCSGRFSPREHVFSSRIIDSHSQGRDVLVLQNRLAVYKKTFLNRPANGKYDNYTAQAVSRIQDDFSIQGEEGVVGPQTYVVILLQSPLGGRTLRKGQHGLDTYFLQLYLHQLGYYNSKPDGFFTSATSKALTSFQSAADIRVDGIAGPQTFLALGNSLSIPQNGFFYRSETGDSISSLSKLFNHSEAKVLKLNGIKSNHKRLKPGQPLKMPVPLAFHLLNQGDSIDTVAEKYGINPENLIKANRLQVRQGLLPGQTLALPGYQAQLYGHIIYLNRREQVSELKCLHLEDMNTEILYIFNNRDINQISTAFSKNKIEISAVDNWQGTYNLNQYKSHPLTPLGNHVITNYLYKAIHMNNISITEGATNFKLLEDPLLFSNKGSSLAVSANIAAIRQLFHNKYISRWRLSPDGSYMLILASVPPARESAAYLVNLNTKQVLKISEHGIDGVFSTDSQQILLITREYFGAYYPWFYQKMEFFSSRGYSLSDQFITRSAEINEDCFNRDNTALVFVMHNPHTFYPLPESQRNLYVKKLNSSLLLQLTSNDKPCASVWI